MDTKALRQHILDLAIRGKLVPQDPDDEPASILLERIRAEKERLIAEGKIKRPKKTKTTSAESHYPNNLPNGWISCKLEDYVDTVTDFVASGSFASLRENVKYYDEPNYAVLVRTKDFQMSFKKDLIYTDEHGYKFLSNSNLKGGELILPNIGASIGKVFIVPELKVPMTLAPNSVMIKFVENRHRDWLYFLFRSTLGQELLFSISNSTAQGKFNKTDFKNLFIPIPPISEQLRIVQEINRWFAIIDYIDSSTSSLKTAINQTKSKILNLAIHGKLVPQNPEDEPASELLRRVNPKARIITDNPHYPQLPDNWVLTNVESLAQLLSGRDLDTSDCNDNGKGLPYLIGASNIVDGVFRITRWTETPQVISTYGDILISCKGTIGEMVSNAVGNVHIARQFMAIRPNQAINREFLYYALESVLDAIKKKANGIIPGISRPVILSQNIALPPIKEQRMIVLCIKKYFYLLSKIISIL